MQPQAQLLPIQTGSFCQITLHNPMDVFKAGEKY